MTLSTFVNNAFGFSVMALIVVMGFCLLCLSAIKVIEYFAFRPEAKQNMTKEFSI